MIIAPYEKLCNELIGGLPDNRRGAPDKSLGKKPTATELAHKLGMSVKAVLCWPLVSGTNIRIIPAGRAELVEKLSNGAVTADEVREFAKQHTSGRAA